MNFARPELIAKAGEEIRKLADPNRHYRIMEVCGGHTHAIYRFGLKDLLPANVELIHGPGCPVCVLPMGRIDDGLSLAAQPDFIFAAFGDMMRVPGTHGSPLEYKARGMDVRIVYSPADALKLARNNPEKHVMFFAIGFRNHRAFHCSDPGARESRRPEQFFRILQSRHHHPRHPSDSRFAGHAPRWLRRSRPCFHRHRLQAIRLDRQGRRQARRSIRLRASGHSAIHRDAAAPASQWRGQS